MNILIVSPRHGVGGAEKIIEAQSSHLLGESNNVIFLDYELRFKHSDEYFSFDDNYQSNTVSLLYRILLFILRNRKKLRLYDVVHGHLTFGIVFCLVLKVISPNIPSLITLHSVGMKTRISQYALSALSTVLLDKVVVVAISNGWKIVFKLFPKKFCYIPNGITFKPSSKVNRFARSDSHDIVIGSICRLSQDREPMRFIELAKQLNDNDKSNLSFHIRLMGYGPLKNSIELSIAKLQLIDRISICDSESNKESFFDSIDLYIGINMGSDTGIAVLEAIDARVPVISIQNFPHHIGSNDWIPSFANITDLATNIKRLFYDRSQLEELQRSQILIAQSRNNAESMQKQYIRIYEEISEG